MTLRECLLTNNDCYKAGRTIIPKGVMVHSTGANNPNLRRYVQPDDGWLGVNKNGNHWNRAGVGKCVHAFIGKLADGSISTYQTLPWDCRGWHAGGDANNTHISFEICEDALTDRGYFQKTYREAVELTAYLCQMYRLDPMKDGVVLCHYEGYQRRIASGHVDITHWWPKFGKTMNDFRREVKEQMELEARVTALERKLKALESSHAALFNDVGTLAARLGQKGTETVYNTLEEVPAYARPTVEKLVEAGVLKGDGRTDENGRPIGLGLTVDMLRTLVILGRMED